MIIFGQFLSAERSHMNITVVVGGGGGSSGGVGQKKCLGWGGKTDFWGFV